MQGMLLVDKPSGWTSFDIVNYVRKIVANAEGKKPKNVKVGHTGTLDPFATGLLVLLIGKEYTKKAETLTKQDKTYEVMLKLGEQSSTGDPEGDITTISDRVPTLEELETAIKPYRGIIQQTPPAYSAIKIDGQRAYKLARAGKEVTIESRKVTINGLEIAEYHYPEITLVADVSSGTYIRTLVEDIGKTLGTGAYTTQLRRTKVGQYLLESALKQEDLTDESIAKNIVT